MGINLNIKEIEYLIEGELQLATEAQLRAQRKYRHSEKGRENAKLYTRQWRKLNPLRTKEINKKARNKVRLEILNYYSDGKLECACCGEKEFKFLTLDHIKGIKNSPDKDHVYKGNRSRIYGSYGTYTWLRKNRFPEGYQVLCYNCNCSKGVYGVCPHREEF